MVVYDLEKREEITEERIRGAYDSHERHFYEARLVYIENMLRVFHGRK